ncbi:MAG: sialidase family protein [candidate division WOR-3 bacterium]
MVVRGDTIYVSWQEFGGTSSGIKFARSFDRGKTWQRFVVDPSRTGITALTVSKSGIIYLAYVSDNIYFTKSYNKGQNWTTPIIIDYVSYSSGYGDRAPINSISVYNDNVLFITWVDSRNGNWDIRGSYSYDGGNTWSNSYIVNKLVSGGQCKSWVSFDPYGNLHLMYYHTPSWPTSSSSKWSIYYQVSKDSGKTWSSPIRVSDTTFLDKAPSSTNGFMGDYHMIVSDSYFVYVIWSDGRDGNQNLYFSKAPINVVVSYEKNSLISYNEEFKIYSVDGRLIGKSKNLNDIRLKKGVYIIRSKNWSFKKVQF